MSIDAGRGRLAAFTDFETSVRNAGTKARPVKSLPGRARLDPVGDAVVDSHIAALLNPLSVHDRALRAALQPPLSDSGIVVPGRYRRLLESATARLRGQPRSAERPLRSALTLLDEVRSSMDQLDGELGRMLEA